MTGDDHRTRVWPVLAALTLLGALACSEEPERPSPSTAATPAATPDPEPAPEPDPPSPAASWRTLDPPAAAGALGASLTATRRGVLATWIEPRGEDAHAVRFATLRGETWSEASTIVERDDLIANWADFPRAELGGDGAIYAHYLQRAGERAYAYQIQLVRSRDGGAHFEPVGLVHRDGTPTEHGFVSMLPAPDGLRLFWLDGRATLADGGATAVYTTSVADEVSEAVRLDDRTCDCCQTDTALAAGGPIVVYRDRDADEVRDIALSRWTGEAFSEPARLHEDGWEIAGCPVNGPAIDADGQRVAVAWFTGADGGSVRLVFSDDGGATFGDPIEVDPDQPPGRVDVRLLDGGAAVSWLARSGRGGEIRVRFVHDDGRLAVPSMVAEAATARASGFPVLVRDGARLLLAYRDGAEPPRLHVAQLPVDALPREVGQAPEAEGEAERLDVGDALPSTHVRGDGDERLTLSALADDGPLLLAFFARWCQPCRRELRQLEALRDRLAPGVRVVAVSLDEGSVARAQGTARGWGFTGRVVRDDGSAAAFGVPPIPGLFFFDQQRVLRGAWRGEAVEDAELLALAGAQP